MTRTDEMRDLLGRWKSSGLSLMAFGKQEEIPYSRLLYWKRKLREEREATDGVEWAEVRVVPEAPTERAPKFDVWLANGVALEVSVGFDEGELRRLIDVLSAC